MATSAETIKSTAEQYTAAGSQAFKDAVEKSMTAMNELNAQSKHNLEAVVASVTAASKGAETLGAQTMAYSKKSMDDYMAAAKSLTTAKSVQEVVELQTACAKSALEGYLAAGEQGVGNCRRLAQGNADPAQCARHRRRRDLPIRPLSSSFRVSND